MPILNILLILVGVRVLLWLVNNYFPHAPLSGQEPLAKVTAGAAATC